MTATARIVQISISSGGVPKHPVASTRVTTLGLEGDARHDHNHHGGPDRALCLFLQERIDALLAEGHPIAPGSIGENLTIAGIDWTLVTPGSYLRLGADVIAQVTRYTAPCANIGASFRDRDYTRVSQTRHAGDSRVYVHILRPGFRSCGDSVALLTDAEVLALIGCQ
jgi:MOSC domain-containing protein YiiM